MLSPRDSPPAPVPTGPLPDLPFEIIRRIIRHRLALTPSYPAKLPDEAAGEDPIRAEIGLAGYSGRRMAMRRVAEREDVQDAAMSLMRVCKAWKPVVMKYLYCEPQLSSSSLLLLAEAVVRGDKKWDNLRLHPHSIPGRYITTLDLSHLSEGYFAPHVTVISRAFHDLLPLLPNVTHLKLPPGQLPFRLSQLPSAPFLTKLRALEGLQIGDERSYEGRYPFIHLLRAMPGLEVLSVLGPGLAGRDLDLQEIDQKPIHLPKLHTLTLDGVKSSLLLSTLLISDLPSIRRLLITSYCGCPGDQTYEFQQVHGGDLISLTYLPTREWPTVHPTPPLDTLDLHPKLRHLSYLLPNSVLQSNRIIATSLARDDHPLSTLTLPKWENLARPSPSPSPAHTPLPQPGANDNNHGQQTPFLSPSAASIDGVRRSNRFILELLSHKPAHLRYIIADGFTWVKPSLGKAALQAGASGEMRIWAQRLKNHGIELLDGEGKVVPVAEGRSGDGGERTRGRRLSRNDVVRPKVRAERDEEDGG
ncbi:hypothetical protein JCM24511_07592 [Saitozyma sp. JCM 24511]|nr:hypothetical protein JCM24511_07592 [Saitozyma sp. JCM 24511]